MNWKCSMRLFLTQTRMTCINKEWIESFRYVGIELHDQLALYQQRMNWKWLSSPHSRAPPWRIRYQQRMNWKGMSNATTLTAETDCINKEWIESKSFLRIHHVFQKHVSTKNELKGKYHNVVWASYITAVSTKNELKVLIHHTTAFSSLVMYQQRMNWKGTRWWGRTYRWVWYQQRMNWKNHA